MLFGGAFGSGREVVEFMSQHGPVAGFVSIVVIAAVYAMCLFLCFELARLYRTYEYRGFYKLLLGRGWVIYEFFITLGVIVALAICASSSGAVLNSHFGLPTLIGGSMLLVLVISLNYGGRTIVERSMVFSVLALSAILMVLLVVVLSSHSAAVTQAFGSNSDLLGAVQGGFRYAITNAGFIPLLLFCAIQLKSRRETLIAGTCAGIAGIAPAIIFHLTFLADYPQVLEATLPTYSMIEQLTPALFLDIYVVVLFVMIAQTGVGVLHGAIERIDARMMESSGAPMGKVGHASVSGIALLASTALASIGLVELIAQGYKYLSIVFILIFALPLLLVGIPRILRQDGKFEAEEQDAGSRLS
ncbi:MAG: hypothetical protein Pars2KO_10750 [Parasphingorhabdus sp.]